MWCSTWTQATAPFIADLMLLARGLQLGALRDWPPCMRLYGIVSEKVVRTIGMDQNSH